jgi:hypothetical protein
MTDSKCSKPTTKKQTTKKKYEIVQVNGIDVTVDVSMLCNTDGMRANATEMARPWGKLPADYLRLDSTMRYIEALRRRYGNSHNDFVEVKKGGVRQGTWMFQKLAVDFARWLSPDFAVAMDEFFIERMDQERIWRTKRLEAKTGFLPMTNAILRDHDPAKHYHYSNEADMINRIVLGMPAKEYKDLHEVESVRDAVTAAELIELNRLQIINTGLIEIGMDYQTRKSHLVKCYENGSQNLISPN